MTDNFAQNLDVLSQIEPELCKFLGSIETDLYEISEENGYPFVKVWRGHEQITLGWHDNMARHIHDLLVEVNGATKLYIVMGMGAGTILKQAYQKSPNSYFLVVESDARIFKKSMQAYDFTREMQSGHVSFVVARKPEFLVSAFSNFVMREAVRNYLPTMALIQDKSVTQYSQAYYDEAAVYIKKTVDYYWEGVVGNSSEDTLIGFNYILENFKSFENMYDFSVLKNYFKDQVGIVVSSGPSLNTKLRALQKYGDRAVVLCADSSLRLLIENGIHPFGVSSIERVPRLVQMYQDIKIPSDLCLFHTFQINPDIIKMFSGLVCGIFRDVFPFELFPQIFQRYNVGFSVAHLNIMVLMLLGCREVALIGQDLAYDRTGEKTHCGGVKSYAVDAESKRERILVPDNAGGMIESHRFWKIFGDFIGHIAEHNPACVIKNVIEPESGAKIPGVTRVDPGEFFMQLENREPLNTRSAIQCLKDNGRMGTRGLNFKNEWSAEVDVIMSGFKTMESYLKDLEQSKKIEDYNEIKIKMMQQLPQGVKTIFENISKPVLRRLESAAACGMLESFPAAVQKSIHDVRLSLDESQKMLSSWRSISCSS